MFHCNFLDAEILLKKNCNTFNYTSSEDTYEIAIILL